MKEYLDRDKTIDNYIISVQIFFSSLVLIILFTHLNLEFYNFTIYKPFAFSGFLILLLVASLIAGEKIKEQNKIRLLMNLVFVLVETLIVALLLIKTGFPEAKLLFLIPIIIGAIKFNLLINISITTCIALVLMVLEINNIQSNAFLISMFFLLSILVGKVLDMEQKLRKNIELTQINLIKKKVFLSKLTNEWPLGLMVIDRDERIIHTNKLLLELFKLPSEGEKNIKGQNFKGCIEIGQTLHTGTSYVNQVHVLEDRVISVTTFPLYNQAGEIVFAIGLVSDITEEEKMQEKMKQLERLNIVGQIAAGFAHEIKNPLTSIKGFLQLALRSPDHFKKDDIELLLSEIDRCNSIIGDFLAVNKKTDSIKERKNFKKIIQKHITLIERDCIFHNMTLQTDLNEVGEIEFNENEIKQLLLNLTRNGIEAMEQGGALGIKLYEKNKKVLLEVEDQGAGIPQDILDNLGTPFLTTKKEGTGLGWSVCYRIAESHQANIEIDSQIGKGTKIRIVFHKGEC